MICIRGDVLIVAFVKEKAASLNTFTVRDVGIKRSDVKRGKYGIVGKCVDCVQVGKFVKEISSVQRKTEQYKLVVLGSSQQTERYVSLKAVLFNCRLRKNHFTRRYRG